MIRVELFVATGCHLCPPARDAVEVALAGMAPETVSVRIRDIDGDLDLERRYREVIPVLVVDGREAARYVFDAAEVRRAIEQAGRSDSPSK